MTVQDFINILSKLDPTKNVYFSNDVNDFALDFGVGELYRLKNYEKMTEREFDALQEKEGYLRPLENYINEKHKHLYEDTNFAYYVG